MTIDTVARPQPTVCLCGIAFVTIDTFARPQSMFMWDRVCDHRHIRETSAYSMFMWDRVCDHRHIRETSLCGIAFVTIVTIDTFARPKNKNNFAVHEVGGDPSRLKFFIVHTLLLESWAERGDPWLPGIPPPPPPLDPPLLEAHHKGAF